MVKKVANITFNPESIKQMTFEQFEKQYKGKLYFDLAKAYELVTGKNPKNESNGKVRKNAKKSETPK